MKKRDSWIVALAVAALLIGVQTVQAGAPADGGYVGIQGGFGTAIVDAKTTDNSTGSGESSRDGTAFSFAEGGLGMDGASYGAFMGYGFRMGSLYVGFEVSGDWSSIQIDPGTFTINAKVNDDGMSDGNSITQASAELAFTGGVNGRIGYYLNPTTLFTLSGGLVGSQFDVSWDNASEEYWDPGVRYGVGMESALFDDIAVRLNWSIIDYYNAEVFGIGSVSETPGSPSVEIQPIMSVAHLGLVYTF